MNVATQISGNIRPGNIALHALKSMLTQLGIHVTHPTKDESLFYEVDANKTWQHYEDELSFYESIADSSFHIVYNDGEINEETSLQILYAMLKARPILMTGAPVFAENLSPFARELVISHLPDFHSVDLPELDLTELDILLRKLKITDYRLSNQARILIQSRVKAHFRDLLEEAKQIHLEKAQTTLRPAEEV